MQQVLMNGCNNLVVKGLKLMNSQRSHLAIDNCNDVMLSQLTITAPGESPNTDGIDVANSRRVRIEWSTIATGDDCIAIKRGAFQINITGIACGPGHGISIGSLGKDKSTSEEVADVIVKQCNFTRAMNGARIKTWQGGVGFARRITFEDINFVSTRNPIIIDQTYCDRPYTNCKSDQSSTVKVEGVTYQRMRGTSSNLMAVTLTCNPFAPCSDIVMKEVVIMRDDGSATSSSCSNALGSIGKEWQRISVPEQSFFFLHPSLVIEESFTIGIKRIFLSYPSHPPPVIHLPFHPVTPSSEASSPIVGRDPVHHQEFIFNQS
ncbi:polygalacturonase-like [Curcuma longa]|uniref:polygalacturonase-like n=1 Tax=Curcuma longa TaxID=136217 RepID=UPI003D9F3BF4